MEENYNEEQQRKQWEQFQEFQRQQEKQKYVKSKSKKPWFWVGVGCLVFFILIIIGIVALTFSMNGGFKHHATGTKNYKIGDTIKNGDLEVKVKSIENTKAVGPSIAPTNAKDTFVVADVSIKNKGDKALTIDSQMFKLKSGDKSFEADATGSVSANQSDDGSITNSFFLEQINPDSTAEGKVVFDVSEKVANTKDKKLEITSSLFSTKSITVDLSDAKTSTKDKKDDDATNDESTSSTTSGSSDDTSSSNTGNSTSSSASPSSNTGSHQDASSSSSKATPSKEDSSSSAPKESEPQESKSAIPNSENTPKPSNNTSSNSAPSSAPSDSSSKSE
ncbi:DUF4352 domain-containing protein [Staphylococcus warneri]|uniref:DUF4352 domain-containing protein n=1 Tax=Staphylococcus warneri TaxID=1292 RepID=UPI00103DEB2C|nr:DUF4352 domain-containing protein [Staphylococcus warneri]MDK4264290.1 DUF4352 domain-containing protein [Staphylococcus warneri]TBW80138.1 DUF4352 domain-containing protein [Staphylococcus warneri]